MRRTTRGERFVAWFLFIAILGAGTLCAVLVSLLAVSNDYERRYAGRIFPGVAVYGVDVSGLAPEEATTRLAAALPNPALLPLTLRSGHHTWQRTWADLGMRFDPAASAARAYAVGRTGPLERQLLERLRARLAGQMPAPVVVLPGATETTRVLEEIAPEIAVLPVNAGLIIRPEGISTTPAQAGRELDIEETVRLLPYVLSFGPEGAVLDLMIRQLEPPLPNPGPVLAEAEALLAQPLTLSGSDQLTGFNGTWSVPSSTVAGWLTVQTVEDDAGLRLGLTVQEEPIRAYLEELSTQLGNQLDGFPRAQQFGLAIDVGVTTHQVRMAVERGAHEAGVAFIHPQRTYTIVAGDTLMSIARALGFPVWRLIQANPGIDTRGLHPGQQIVIPSADVLFPYPLITERRIVVDLSEQHLYAYEGETLVYDFIASTGIESSPTMPGTFQVLSKEEEAYASNWDLWMPHFMGVYQSAPDFTNGIHGLPTLSSGARLWAGYLGRPVSFGCIVLGLEEAATLYEWAELGTMVVIQP
jgi:lipoprotein-anchoring transpeptidase ErfK/SrfK